jgi:hypothetical protein
MIDKHTYTDRASYMDANVEWKLVLLDQKIIVTCDKESRVYDIPEPVKDFKTEDNYVFIYVENPEFSYYQFKFEEDMFFVGDRFDANDEHVGEFACWAFGEE